MNPENGETRPARDASPAANKTTNTNDSSVTPETASGRDFTHERWPRHRPHRPEPRWTAERGHRSRYLAALRCEPLADGRRDPDEPLRDEHVARVATFGLTPEQLQRERQRLLALGWSAGEVAAVLGAGVTSMRRSG